MHIAFLEMVIDPVCSLVFEAETEEDDVMRRPPRSPDEPLFSGPDRLERLLQGAFAFALVAAIFVIAFRRGMPETEVRALAFFSLVMTIVSLIFVNRSFSASLITAFRRPNPALALVLACRHDDAGPDASVAVCQRSLPVRPAARGRSRADAGRRRSCACCPRGFKAPLRGMAAKSISARRCFGSPAMMRTVYVRSWHFADIPPAPTNVRYWG